MAETSEPSAPYLNRISRTLSLYLRAKEWLHERLAQEVLNHDAAAFATRETERVVVGWWEDQAKIYESFPVRMSPALRRSECQAIPRCFADELGKDVYPGIMKTDSRGGLWTPKEDAHWELVYVAIDSDGNSVHVKRLEWKEMHLLML